MKKAITLIVATVCLFGCRLSAQPGINQAVDFTATDIHGNQIHLFDILDQGKYVLLDFFFTTCSGCIQIQPSMVQAYQRLGCNQHEVFFIEVTYTDNTTAATNWCNQYGVEYPTIPRENGGMTIDYQYGIEAYPTVVLIAPDRSFAIADLWPISSAQSIVNALVPFGIQEHECTTGIEEQTLEGSKMYPNPADGFIILEDETATFCSVYDMLGKQLGRYENLEGQLRIVTKDWPAGFYFLQTDSGVRRKFIVRH